MNKSKITSVIRTIVEVAALVLFAILLMKHRMQMWIIIFGISALLSIFFGRFYCSWICPMNTLFRPIRWLYGKMKIKRLKTPEFMNNTVRIILLVLFLVSMVVTKKTGLKIDIIFYITVFSVFLTLFFEERFWHRSLCPFGTILSLTSRASRYRMQIDEAACISCGKCQKVCPTASIITLENRKRRNIKNECLLCGRCIDVCPELICQIKI